MTSPFIKPGQLEEDYQIKTFFENKRFPSFSANRPIKFKVQLCNQNFKTVWAYLTSQETALKVMN